MTLYQSQYLIDGALPDIWVNGYGWCEQVETAPHEPTILVSRETREVVSNGTAYLAKQLARSG